MPRSFCPRRILKHELRSHALNILRVTIGIVGTLMLICTTACGEEETRTLVPETPDGNLEVRDGEITDSLNLDPGPAAEPEVD